MGLNQEWNKYFDNDRKLEYIGQKNRLYSRQTSYYISKCNFMFNRYVAIQVIGADWTCSLVEDSSFIECQATTLSFSGGKFAQNRNCIQKQIGTTFCYINVKSNDGNATNYLHETSISRIMKFGSNVFSLYNGLQNIYNINVSYNNIANRIFYSNKIDYDRYFSFCSFADNQFTSTPMLYFNESYINYIENCNIINNQNKFDEASIFRGLRSSIYLKSCSLLNNNFKYIGYGESRDRNYFLYIDIGQSYIENNQTTGSVNLNQQTVSKFTHLIEHLNMGVCYAEYNLKLVCDGKTRYYAVYGSKSLTQLTTLMLS